MRSLVVSLVFLSCAQPMPTGPGGIGAPCGSVDCAAGLSCVTIEGFTDGYCTQLCPDGTCPSGTSCSALIVPSICLAGCQSASDCRSGYQCWQGGCQPLCQSDAQCNLAGATCNAGHCMPVCTQDSDCGALMRCAGGVCMPLDGGATHMRGDPCSSSADCAEGACLPSAYGGICTIDCAQPQDCFVFSFDAGCGAVPFDDNGDGSPDRVRALCVPFAPGTSPDGALCTSDAQCQTRTCQDGQCTEGCNDVADCILGQSCVSLARSGGSFQGCGYAPRTSAVQIDVIDAGTIDVRAGGGGDLPMAVPSDAVSLTLQIHMVGGDPLPLTFGSLSDSMGTSLFSLSDLLDWIDQPVRWIPEGSTEAVAMLVPDSTPDRVAMMGGVYHWNAGAFVRMSGDTGRVQLALSAIVKRAPAPPTTGTLNLHIWLVDVGLSAATAPTDTRLGNTLARLGSIYAEAGIALGTITYTEVTGTDATRYGVIDSTDGPDSELAGLFRLASGVMGTLDVFLVRSLSSGESSFYTLGVAGGIPGPVGLGPSAHSGVVLAFDRASIGSSQAAGTVMAHEIGHYLGLYHSTERARPCGTGEDPAMDMCSPFGGGDVLTDTMRGDDTNVMNWSIVGDGTNNILSAGQCTVMRQSPLVGP